MVKIVEMDEKVTLNTQLEGDVGAVILLNKFTVKPEDIDQFLKVFAATTKVMKQQPGFISAQLHRGIAGSSTFFNYAVFESAEHFKRAFNTPEFRSTMASLPPQHCDVSSPIQESCSARYLCGLKSFFVTSLFDDACILSVCVSSALSLA
jgi:quinol monooxygenase YgiN